MHAAENPLKLNQYKLMALPLLAYQTLSFQIKDPLIHLQLSWGSH